MFLFVYQALFWLLTPFIRLYLRARQRRGKEHAVRMPERFGVASAPRPAGKVLWVNAVSVGEAQSALILLEALKAQYPHVHILFTTVTTTSAELMAKRLPAFGGVHQFTPVDHPAWVERFLTHWQPDACIWMEKELWPTFLSAIKKRAIPCVLMNAHMSAKSFRLWRVFKNITPNFLSAFAMGFAQTDEACGYYRALGLRNIETIDNLKYAAKPLPYDDADYAALEAALAGRPVWVYASTHAGEEILAAKLHEKLKAHVPNLLTIIAPRHPARRDEITAALQKFALKIALRGAGKNVPAGTNDIYIADTMGELGLFYKLAPIACIGRSFSDDGGGGHNPIEPAQFGCAVLYGPNMQNQTDIVTEMNAANAAQQVPTEEAFFEALHSWFTNPAALHTAQENARNFAGNKGAVLSTIMGRLTPYFKGL